MISIGIIKLAIDENPKETNMPMLKVLALAVNSEESCLVSAIDKDTIGPINGAKIIAPIITGAELANKPTLANKVDNAINVKNIAEGVALSLSN